MSPPLLYKMVPYHEEDVPAHVLGRASGYRVGEPSDGLEAQDPVTLKTSTNPLLTKKRSPRQYKCSECGRHLDRHNRNQHIQTHRKPLEERREFKCRHVGCTAGPWTRSNDRLRHERKHQNASGATVVQGGGEVPVPVESPSQGTMGPFTTGKPQIADLPDGGRSHGTAWLGNPGLFA
ncbi:hypothetical protein GY45DRAFT_428697 [Cubamyces sp. BRFM 1775]|nr:hypothetical protein GY45DRAFT_428697 [Cubamyces sp. BRFM 1775]